jgi:hypothetical protein
MTTSKFILGLLVLAIAFLLQLWFPVSGIRGDFVLAALIAFAFIYNFWEVVFFSLFAAFVVNWQPVLSVGLLIFALIPLVVFVLHRLLRWEPWMGIAVSTASGIFLFYAVTAPMMIVPNLGALVEDVIACVIFGEVLLWGMG